MTGTLSKEAITGKLEQQSAAFSLFCSTISDEVFFRQPAVKWSIAQNITHLITSAKMTRLVYRLPKFMVRLYTGKPNRPPRSYDELVAKYISKLEQGGKASGKFVAKPVPAAAGKGALLQSFSKAMASLTSTMEQWEDAALDQYLAPHPLLGKITLRELGYFTIYHTEHHLAIIKERLND